MKMTDCIKIYHRNRIGSIIKILVFINFKVECFGIVNIMVMKILIKLNYEN